MASSRRKDVTLTYETDSEDESERGVIGSVNKDERIVNFADDEDAENAAEATQVKSVFSEEDFMGQMSLHPWLRKQLIQEGFTKMTQVQQQAIPKCIRGDDCLIRCQTGSGKSLAFLVPCIQYLIRIEPPENRAKGASGPLDRSNGTHVMIIAPTRELLQQTIDTAIRLTIPFPRIVVSSVCGGEKRKSEKARLRKGVTLLGATVGRICDHTETTSSFIVSRLGILVLDEADRLLDMNGEARLKHLTRQLMQLRETQREADSLRLEARANAMKDSTSSNDFLESGNVKQQIKRRKLGSVPEQTREKESNGGSGDASTTRISDTKPFQTILVSATLTPGVRQLAGFLLSKDAQWVDVDGGTEEQVIRDPGKAARIDENGADAADSREAASLTIPAQLKQYSCVVTLKKRLVTLIAVILQRAAAGKIVVFVSNCEAANYYQALMSVVRWPSAAYFDDRSQKRFENKTMHGSELPPELKNKKLRKIAKKFAAGKITDEKSFATDDFSSGELSTDADDSDSDADDYIKAKQALDPLLGARIFPEIQFFKLHGDMAQMDRAGNLRDFNKATKNAVLFATDCGARGLNFNGVRWVVQLDPPNEIAEYVHRVGRTARIGGEGNALMFLLDHEVPYAQLLASAGVKLHPMTELEIMQALLQDHFPEDLRRRKNRGNAAQMQEVPALLNSSIFKQVAADVDLLHMARRSFTSSLRAYCIRPDKKCFDSKKLHTGHLGSALGLTEAPSRIAVKCRAGAEATAARQVIAEHKSGPRNNDRFNKIAEGLLHNVKKEGLAKTMTVQVAQQILAKQQKGRAAAKPRKRQAPKIATFPT